MINLFTYLSFTNISVGQLYQHFVIILFALIIISSAYFSLAHLSASTLIRARFTAILTGFLLILCNSGLFFYFIYLSKSSFATSAIWFPVFNITVQLLNLWAQSIIATAMVAHVSRRRKPAWKGIIFVTLVYLLMLMALYVLFLFPSLCKPCYKLFVQNNYFILAGNLLFVFLAGMFFMFHRQNSNGVLSLSVFSLIAANGFQASTIFYPRLTRYLVLYNLLTILAYVLVEIYIFYEIIKAVSINKNEIQKLNDDLEGKIDERTQELFNSNKELFQANYMLHQEKEKLNAIIDNLDEGIILSNVSNKVLLMNDSAHELLGLDGPTSGRSLSEILPDRSFIQDINNVILKKVKKTSKEIHFETSSPGERYIQIKSTLSTDSKGNIIGIITLVRDISKEVEIEQLKTGFLRTISHELKTPLTTIIGFSETLASQRRGNLNDEQKEFLDIIIKESMHLHRLIDDLLEFTKSSSKKISLFHEEVNLKAMLHKIVESFQPKAQVKNLKFELQTDIDLPTIQADREKLNRAFCNILQNALDYTSEGGVKISFETGENYITTRIADTGVGIAPDEFQRIFETFVHLDRSVVDGYKSGLGLGLSIARDNILLHDGKIWLESDVGRGTTFFIQLPIVR